MQSCHLFKDSFKYIRCRKYLIISSMAHNVPECFVEVCEKTTRQIFVVTYFGSRICRTMNMTNFDKQSQRFKKKETLFIVEPFII